MSTARTNINRLKLNTLLETENSFLQKLNDIVIQSIEEEKLISQKIAGFEDDRQSFGNRLSDKVASFGGSWSFILLFVALMIVWILSNVYLLSGPFDPYPFILLNLILSTIAALQAPLILMSQNRKDSRDRQRAIN